MRARSSSPGEQHHSPVQLRLLATFTRTCTRHFHFIIKMDHQRKLRENVVFMLIRHSVCGGLLAWARVGTPRGGARPLLLAPYTPRLMSASRWPREHRSCPILATIEGAVWHIF
jgi:hypothetical protein